MKMTWDSPEANNFSMYITENGECFSSIAEYVAEYYEREGVMPGYIYGAKEWTPKIEAEKIIDIMFSGLDDTDPGPIINQTPEEMRDSLQKTLDAWVKETFNGNYMTDHNAEIDLLGYPLED